MPVPNSPAFGQADLTNCERELIHLAGSVQPHGALLVLSEPGLVVLQASANTDQVLGRAPDRLLGHPAATLGDDLVQGLRRVAASPELGEPVPLRCRLPQPAGGELPMEGTVHRTPGGLVVELERVDTHATNMPPRIDLDKETLLGNVHGMVERFSHASSIGVLSDAVAQTFRDLTGYDRVMVYKFDPDGHGKIIAEARDPRLDSLLGHHYPASDIPQRARELYMRNRVRVLADVHYTPSPLVPRLSPLTGEELDMSQCHLRSMSPLHLQYLKNMGVTATLVVSLVHEGRLWGLVAAHHYTPRNLSFAIRSACELLAEVISTRIAAIENYAHAQVALLVRRLEQRLIEATSTEGDWRQALFRNPRTLLQPLEATGAALFYDGDILTSGEVPSTPELRALRDWVDRQHVRPLFSCSSVSRANPALDSLTPLASGVLAIPLSVDRPDYLMWFRKEQLLTVTWAGDPTKAVVGNDPLELSPRRSFAAWSEIVRGTALPWSSAEIVLARAIGNALCDIVLQVHAVRFLIAEHQLSQTRALVASATEPVVLCGADGRVLYLNEAFSQLTGVARHALVTLEDMAAQFTDAALAHKMIDAMTASHQPWRGEMTLRGAGTPVRVRADVVPGRDGALLGCVFILVDLTEVKRTEAARRQLEAALSLATAESLVVDEVNRTATEPDKLMSAILTNASLAAMDIADAAGGPSFAQMLEALEQSTQRATRLYQQMRQLPPRA